MREIKRKEREEEGERKTKRARERGGRKTEESTEREKNGVIGHHIRGVLRNSKEGEWVETRGPNIEKNFFFHILNIMSPK